MTYVDLLAASNALIADARHRIFFMLHDHHVLPHHYPDAERKRRDRILLQRGWDAAVNRNDIAMKHVGPDDVVLTGQSSWHL